MSPRASVSSISGGRNAREQALSALVDRCAAQDQAALAALYDETSRQVYGVTLSLLRDAADAEEVTLDVYNQIWRGARDYTTSRGTVTAWLVMLARSRAIDRIRSRTSRTRFEESLDSQPIAAAFAGNDPEQDAAASQRRERINRALSTLSPDQRQTLELAFFSGYSHAELAVRLGEPLGTIKTRIRVGMARLRLVLDGAMV